jgi:hypothetical protein
MAYVGIGWALARLPRFRWTRVAAAADDPLLSWLVLDGYGFHQAYFHTRRYVAQRYRDPVLPWSAGVSPDYAARAIDQGIGRALWFVAGADPVLAANLVEDFAAARRADLYSGVALAATYAGGADERELLVLRERAGCYRPQLAQGSAFAAEARARAGLVITHTALATEVFCGMAPAQAAALARRTRPRSPVDGMVPAYEQWRVQVAGEFTELGLR